MADPIMWRNLRLTSRKSADKSGPSSLYQLKAQAKAAVVSGGNQEGSCLTTILTQTTTACDGCCWSAGLKYRPA
jgi:hypothetical protein